MISKDLLQKGPCVLHVKHKVLTLFQRTIIFLYEKAVTHQKRRRAGENMKGASVLCQIKIGFQKLKSPLQGMQKTGKNQYIDWTAMDTGMWKTPWKM